jgi:hypothetical protein
MDTIVRPEAPPDGPIGSTAKHRRWPRRVAGIVVALLLLAVVSGVVWVSNVEPLGRGSFGSAIRDPRVKASEHQVDAFGVSGLINTVRVEKGTTFTYVVSIRNDGPVPVTIKDIGMKGGAITTRVVAMNPFPYENGGPSRGFVPFTASRLDPEQDAIIEMEAQVGANACVEGRGFTSWFPGAGHLLDLRYHAPFLRRNGHRDPTGRDPENAERVLNAVGND